MLIIACAHKTCRYIILGGEVYGERMYQFSVPVPEPPLGIGSAKQHASTVD